MTWLKPIRGETFPGEHVKKYDKVFEALTENATGKNPNLFNKLQELLLKGCNKYM
jgi:hypothetical protein